MKSQKWNNKADFLFAKKIKIFSHHLYEVGTLDELPILNSLIATKGLKFIFHSENCFSVKNSKGLFLTAFPEKEVKFFAKQCSTWEKFYILDEASQQLIDRAIVNGYKDMRGHTICNYELFFENNKLMVSLGATLFAPSYIPAPVITNTHSGIAYTTNDNTLILNKKSTLVYFCIYGKQEYYDCFKLAVKSLIELGGYQGDILIKTDDIDKVKGLMGKFDNLCHYSLIDESLGIFNRYWLYEDVLADYDTIIYLDSDILTVNSVNRLFYEFAEKAEFLAYIETDSKLYQKSDADRYTWWGADYLLYNEKISTVDYFMYNSGFFVINNLQSVRIIFDRVVRYRSFETNTGDQPWLNLALYNSGLSIYGIPKNYELVFSRNLTQSHNAFNKTWIHFNSGVGNLSKLNLMQKIYSRLVS